MTEQQHNKSTDATDAILAAAIRTAPLPPLPGDFVDQVLQRAGYETKSRLNDALLVACVVVLLGIGLAASFYVIGPALFGNRPLLLVTLMLIAVIVQCWEAISPRVLKQN